MKMTDQDVIDLTNSFTLADHTALSNVVIELDDTINENDTYAPEEARTRIENNAGRLSQNREKSKKSRKKAGQPHKPIDVANVELVRERSPLRSPLGDCPICLESIGSKPLDSTKCGHVFCHQCLIEALNLEKKCPVCRLSLRGKSSYHPLFF